MNQIPMTLRGAERLREELNELKTVKRPRIIASIADAREHGDLKENAEYHAAREEQGFCEGRIQENEAKLSNAQVIDVTQMPKTGRVIFGATVTVMLSGLMVSRTIATAIGVTSSSGTIWNAVHSLSATGTIALLVAHFGLHASWIARTLRGLVPAGAELEEVVA